MGLGLKINEVYFCWNSNRDTTRNILIILSVVFVSLGTQKEDGEGEGYLSVVHGARHRGEVAQHHLANKYF